MELAEFINDITVERAWKRVLQAQEDRDERIALAGMRAARARDKRLMLALELGAKVLNRMSERQFGQSGMDVNGMLVPATEAQLWRNAYTTADNGTTIIKPASQTTGRWMRCGGTL